MDELPNILARLQEHSPPRCELIALHPAEYFILVSRLKKELPEYPSYLWQSGTEGYPKTYMGIILESDHFIPRGKAKVYERASDYREEVKARNEHRA